jgi:hypothetical protein
MYTFQMRKFILFSLFLLTGALAHGATQIHVSEAGLTDNNGQPVTVVGQLGKPLNSALQVVTCERTDFRGMDNPIAVYEVDGRVLNQPAILDLRWTGTNIALMPGVPYKLQGYESGEFSTPTGLTTNTPPAHLPPVHFHSLFVVTKVVETSANSPAAAH